MAALHPRHHRDLSMPAFIRMTPGHPARVRPKGGQYDEGGQYDQGGQSGSRAPDHGNRTPNGRHKGKYA